jgi:non-canonical (house-cleaning) NTP pyrophosphatase
MEGGVQLVGGELECFAWIAIYNGKEISLARTGSFFLPHRIKVLVVDEGLELGEADDKVFGSINSKQAAGAVGALTKGVIDRSLYYTHAVILATVKFLWPELYAKE